MGRTPIAQIAQFAPLTIYIRGKVAFSRIASKIDGAELAKQNQEAAAKGRMPHSKPYITITIKNPMIINPDLPMQVATVIQERFYTSKTDGCTYFSQESKSPFLPIVVYSKEAGELAGQGIADDNIPLQAEFAKDLDVTIGVSLFNNKGFAGLGIDHILVNEPIRYYSSSSIAAGFATQGITYKPPVATQNVTGTNVKPIQEQYVPPVSMQPVSEVPMTAQPVTVENTYVPPTNPYQAPFAPSAAPFATTTTSVGYQPANFASADTNSIPRPVRFYE